MNAWKKFIVNSIIDGKQYPKEMLDPVLELYLTRYRRNQFESVPKLIGGARHVLNKEMILKNKNVNNNAYLKG